jgi:hypothetical protein
MGLALDFQYLSEVKNGDFVLHWAVADLAQSQQSLDHK